MLAPWRQTTKRKAAYSNLSWHHNYSKVLLQRCSELHSAEGFARTTNFLAKTGMHVPMCKSHAAKIAGKS